MISLWSIGRLELTGYAEYGSVGRVQLQYAERFVLRPLLQALIRIEIHDNHNRLSGKSSAVRGDRPVYGQRATRSGRQRHRRRADETGKLRDYAENTNSRGKNGLKKAAEITTDDNVENRRHADQQR